MSTLYSLYWTDVNGRKWPVCSCLKAWLPVYQDELIRRGVIKRGLDVYQTIGGSSKSGGTHVSGQCVDTGQRSAEAIKVARQMGADASWNRPYNWDNAKGMAHAHLNLRGCPHGSAAADRQYSSEFQGVDHGKNGLANGAPDPGPKPLSKRTWQQGIAWAKALQKPKTNLRFATFNLPGADKLPKPADRIKAAVALLTPSPPALIGWQELVGIKSAGVPSDFAHDLDAALGENWLLVKPTKMLNENYISFDRTKLKLIKQYDDQILKAATGNRHITRAVFQDRETGFIFAVGNGQLVSTPKTATAVQKAAQEADRQKQAGDAHRFMTNVTAHHDNCPFILMFDANTSKPLKALTAAGMKWTRTYADNSSTRDDTTYTNYSKTKPSTNAADWIIDQCYVSPEFYCVGYSVRRKLTSAGDYVKPRASDHDVTVSSVRHPA